MWFLCFLCFDFRLVFLLCLLLVAKSEPAREGFLKSSYPPYLHPLHPLLVDRQRFAWCCPLCFLIVVVAFFTPSFHLRTDANTRVWTALPPPAVAHLCGLCSKACQHRFSVFGSLICLFKNFPASVTSGKLHCLNVFLAEPLLSFSVFALGSL